MNSCSGKTLCPDLFSLSDKSVMQTTAQSFAHRPDRSVLLSVRPKYADKIVAGIKRVEFRRVWASSPVNFIVFYSTMPTSKVVGCASICQVIEASPSALWKWAEKFGGGLTKQELVDYFDGRETGFALVLRDILVTDDPIDPVTIFPSFRAPQSFRYLTPSEHQEFTEVSRKWYRAA